MHVNLIWYLYPFMLNKIWKMMNDFPTQLWYVSWQIRNLKFKSRGNYHVEKTYPCRGHIDINNAWEQIKWLDKEMSRFQDIIFYE